MILRHTILAFTACATLPQSARGAGDAAFNRGTDGRFFYDDSQPYGPSNWGSVVVGDQVNECNGRANSPIAITSRNCDEIAQYEFNDGTCSLMDEHFNVNDHVLHADVVEESDCDAATMRIPGVVGTWELLQFHMHSGSEHTVDGSHYESELHMVHRLVDEGGDFVNPPQLAVVGLFIRADNEERHELFQRLFDGWVDYYQREVYSVCGAPGPWLDDPLQEEGQQGGRKTRRDRDLVSAYNGESAPPPPNDGNGISTASTDSSDSSNEIFSPYRLIPEGATFYNYRGGLTTPPCTEIVNWNVADRHVSISPGQYSQLVQLILHFQDVATCQPASVATPSGVTSRPVQRLNGRTVRRICAEPQEDEEPQVTDVTATTNGGGGYSMTNGGGANTAMTNGAEASTNSGVRGVSVIGAFLVSTAMVLGLVL